MCSVFIISVCRLICKFAALGNLPEQHPSHILHRFCGQLSFRVRGKSERYEIPIEDDTFRNGTVSIFRVCRDRVRRQGCFLLFEIIKVT